MSDQYEDILAEAERKLIVDSMLKYIDDFDTFVIKKDVDGKKYKKAIKKLRSRFKDLRKGKNIEKVINMEKIDELKEAIMDIENNRRGT